MRIDSPKHHGASSAKLAAIAFVIALGAGGAAYYYLTGLSTFALPSYEGLHLIFVGVQPAGSSTVYTGNANPSQLCVDNAGSCSFVQSVPDSGQFASTSQGTYSYNIYDQTEGTVKFCTHPILLAPPNCVSILITPATQQPQFQGSISYRLNNGYAATGSTYLTSWQITLASSPGSDVNTQFRGDVLWFAEVNQAWQNVNEGGPNNGATWATSILTEFLNANCLQQGNNNCATNPGIASGIQPITLYSVPQTTSAFGNLISQPSQIGSVNSTLASQGVEFPSSQMQQYGFFPVTLTDFGSYGCGTFSTGECDNTLQLSGETYTLQMGTYTFTNPITQTQTANTF
ncbi:MAG: hypothetical protein KGI71_04615, partial [Patescibacteria group bacterium]|nr:hypothetical protein [Patescibacteria group bacterium]